MLWTDNLKGAEITQIVNDLMSGSGTLVGYKPENGQAFLLLGATRNAQSEYVWKTKLLLGRAANYTWLIANNSPHMSILGYEFLTEEPKQRLLRELVYNVMGTWAETARFQAIIKPYR